MNPINRRWSVTITDHIHVSGWVLGWVPGKWGYPAGMSRRCTAPSSASAGAQITQPFLLLPLSSPRLLEVVCLWLCSTINPLLIHLCVHKGLFLWFYLTPFQHLPLPLSQPDPAPAPVVSLPLPSLSSARNTASKHWWKHRPQLSKFCTT